MKLILLIAALPAALIFAGSGTAKAEQTIEEVGALVCVMDKWVEKELDKGHKVVELVGSLRRCPR